MPGERTKRTKWIPLSGEMPLGRLPVELLSLLIQFDNRNYLRRGGQPNVAKNSPSLKSVKEGYGLLHALIAIKNTKAVARVIEAGANPNAVTLSPVNDDRVTPLVLAASLGYINGVRLLLERAQADLYQRGPCQETALHAAIKADAADVVLYLLQVSNNALLDIVDVAGTKKPTSASCDYDTIPKTKRTNLEHPIFRLFRSNPASLCMQVGQDSFCDTVYSRMPSQK